MTPGAKPRRPNAQAEWLDSILRGMVAFGRTSKSDLERLGAAAACR